MIRNTRKTSRVMEKEKAGWEYYYLHCVVRKGCSGNVHQAGNDAMQISGRRTLLAGQTGSAKILNLVLCSGNGWRPAWLEQTGQDVWGWRK